MAANKKTGRVSDDFRELSDKELREITKGFGEQVKAQSLAQKEKMKASLSQAIIEAKAAFIAGGNSGA